MKQISKFLILAAVMLSFTAATFAQASSTATATATIVVPISISAATANMSFGNVIQTAPAAIASVTLDPATGLASYSNATASATPALTAAITRATFTVSGTPGAAYSIGLPASVTLNGPGTNTMTANAFSSSPATPGALSAAGTQTLYIGATLNLIANQAGGTYTSGNFTVTVNYQ
jgi:hypothetical protein